MATSGHELYIGILSGTSLDGLDLVLTAIDPEGTISHRAAMSWPLPDDLRSFMPNIMYSWPRRISALWYR